MRRKAQRGSWRPPWDSTSRKSRPISSVESARLCCVLFAGQCFSDRVYGIVAGAESGDRQFEDARHGPFGLGCDRRVVVLGYPLQHLKDVSRGDCFDRHFANSWENGPLRHLEPLGLGDFLPVLQCQLFLGDTASKVIALSWAFLIRSCWR